MTLSFLVLPLPRLRPLAALLLLACATALGTVSAAESVVPAASRAAAASAADEGKEIASERAAVQADFVSRERECRDHFVVTPCLDQAKADRRQALDKLRARQIALDEARRHQRSAQRKAELQEKAAEDARRDSLHAARSAASAASGAASQPASGRPIEGHRPASASSAASAVHGPAHPASAGTGAKAKAQEPRAVREQREHDSRAAFEARQVEAAQHREEAIDRTTKRMSEKPAAAPLPVPPAASTSSSRPVARP
jgi:hypothetical protein